MTENQNTVKGISEIKCALTFINRSVKVNNIHNM